jgi:hypothetical protein
VSIDYDFSELLALAADLGRVPAEVALNVKKAVTVTALKVKKDWASEAKRSGLAGYAASVTYDVKESRGGVEAEIGPDLGRNQGSFGFVEEGGGGVRSAPQHAGRNASRKNEQDFVDGLEKAIGDFL